MLFRFPPINLVNVNGQKGTVVRERLTVTLSSAPLVSEVNAYGLFFYLNLFILIRG